MKYHRPLQDTLMARLREPRKFIQVIAGPRQVGKTTVAIEIEEQLSGIVAYHSADDTVNYGSAWVDQIWESLRIRMTLGQMAEAVLIIDEIQKVRDWSIMVKKNWDRDTREKRGIKLLLLGSSRLLLMDGLSESLFGRYELSYAGHWTLKEMQGAFGFSSEQYQWFGGYPGAASLINDELRFKEYIRNAIIEPTLTRDILMTAKIDKPALLRQLFEVGTAYSAQIMSYNRMLGQLQDAGNTTTLARYLKLLEQAGLLSGLNKYSGREIETKGTIPKFQIHNTALLSALKTIRFEEALSDRANWGSIFESSVGTYLVDQVSRYANSALYYWRENNAEADYVVTYGKQILGIEVKSGDESISEKNATKFRAKFPKARLILVGRYGIPYDIFMNMELPDLFAL
jgi:predicted AAA+ superfamily ATPase